ncbi:MAG: TIR domain-containing protein [Pseudomonadota bacterium]
MVKVFISYAHEDKEYFKNIKKHLGPITGITGTAGIIELWADDEIKPGEDWNKEILQNLGEADIILFLVSHHFLNSRYIRNNELAVGYERREGGSAVIIPILLTPCYWDRTALNRFQALPIDATDNRLKPIEVWNIQNEAYNSIVKAIERKAADVIEERQLRAKEEKIQNFIKECNEYLNQTTDFELSIAQEHSLDDLRRELGLSEEEASRALAQVRQPLQTRIENLQRYLKTVEAYLSRGKIIDVEPIASELKQRQQVLNLQDSDIESLKTKIDQLIVKYQVFRPENIRTFSILNPDSDQGVSQPVSTSDRIPIVPRETTVQCLLRHAKSIKDSLSMSSKNKRLRRKNLAYIVPAIIMLVGSSLFIRYLYFINISDGQKVFTRECSLFGAFSDFLPFARDFQRQWKNQPEKRPERPEQLIYINNNMLKAYDQKNYHTIAVTISVPDGIFCDQHKVNFAKEILRGVAQLQTKVNLGFFKKIKPQKNFGEPFSGPLPPLIDGIAGKGLKVIVVNDNDDIDKAKKVAETISKTQQVMGLIGHYASLISQETVQTYRDNDLAMISSGSTSSWFTNKNLEWFREKHSVNFFRTVFSVDSQATAVAQFLLQGGFTSAISFYSKEDQSFSQKFNDSFDDKFEHMYGKIIPLEGYRDKLGRLSNHDISNIVSQLKDKGKFAALFIPNPVDVSPNNALMLMSKIPASKIMGTWKLRDEFTANYLSNRPHISLDTFVFAVPWDRQNDIPASKNFLDDANILWKTKRLQPVTATTYDATQVLFYALKKLGNNDNTSFDRKSVIDALNDPSFIVEDGVTGPIQFKKGDRIEAHSTNKVVHSVTFVHLLRCSNYNKAEYFPIAHQKPDC